MVSCGLRTPPHNLPEVIPKPTFNNFKVQQRGQSIRMSLTINETERKNALKNLADDFDQQDYFLVQEQLIVFYFQVNHLFVMGRIYTIIWTFLKMI